MKRDSQKDYSSQLQCSSAGKKEKKGLNNRPTTRQTPRALLQKVLDTGNLIAELLVFCTLCRIRIHELVYLSVNAGKGKERKVYGC